jgi:hypothetical protein
MPYSTYLANQLLNEAFGGAAYTPPATIYIGLSSTTPTAAGGNVTEPSTGSYARVVVTNNTTNWPTTSTGSKSNATVITFPASTAAWLASAALTSFVIYDAATAGNMLASGALNNPQIVNSSGVTLSFAVGTLTITQS